MEKQSLRSEFLSHSDVSQYWVFNCDCLPKEIRLHDQEFYEKEMRGMIHILQREM